jgi:hypothetical protein
MICVCGALPCCAIWGGRDRKASAREEENRDHYKGIRTGSVMDEERVGRKGEGKGKEVNGRE